MIGILNMKITFHFGISLILMCVINHVEKDYASRGRIAVLFLLWFFRSRIFFRLSNFFVSGILFSWLCAISCDLPRSISDMRQFDSRNGLIENKFQSSCVQVTFCSGTNEPIFSLTNSWIIAYTKMNVIDSSAFWSDRCYNWRTFLIVRNECFFGIHFALQIFVSLWRWRARLQKFPWLTWRHSRCA